MARLIDAESKQNSIFVSDFVIEQMKKIPTVDAVPVVRCRECKHRDPEDKKCDCGCWHIPFTTNDYDFCSYGEKRTDFVDDNKIGERRADER